MNAFQAGILSYLLNSLWQVPLLGAAGWLTARILRRVGATAEHIVWVCVLLMQVLVPVTSALSWQWATSLWFWTPQPESFRTGGVTVLMGPGTPVSSLRIPTALLAAIALVYCAVIAGFALRFLRRCLMLRALRQQAAPLLLNGEAAQHWVRAARTYGIDQVSLARVSLATSPLVFGPVTLGIRHKLVLLPAGMVHLPETELQTIIAHEFAHIHRNDFLKNLLYELLSLPLSYHPLFSLTREKIMETREMVCDRMAARHAGDGEYARSLLRLAALLVTGAPFRTPHAIGIFDANTFERRIMRLARTTELQGWPRFAILAVCAAFMIATCGSALAFGLRLDADSAKSNVRPTDTPGRVNVSPKVMQGNILNKVPPVYPADAKKARIQGKVVLDAIIGKDGTVENLKVASGPQDLQQSALDAVRQWTYKPFLLNGQPVEVKTTINVVYALQK